MKDRRDAAAEAISDAALDEVQGGLPAVQKTREAAARIKATNAAPASISDGASNTILLGEIVG